MEITYFVYTLLLMSFVAYGVFIQTYLRTKVEAYALFSFIPLLIIFFLEGYRYEVGTDWSIYVEMYEKVKAEKIFNLNILRGIEPIYTLLNYIFVKLGCSYNSFFGCISVIQIFLVTWCFKSFPKYLVFGMFFLCTGYLTQSQNIMRQCLSVSIALAAIVNLAKSKNVKFLVLEVIASFIHYSSIILLPFYFINKKIFKILDNRLIAIFLFICAFSVGHFLMGLIESSLPFLIQDDKYLNSASHLDVTHEYNSGMGLIFNVVVSLVIIYFSTNIIPLFKSINLRILYRIFIVGCILQNAFGSSMFLARVPMVLTFVKILLLPITIYYLLKINLPLKLSAIFIVVFYVVGFYMAIKSGGAGCSPYQFDITGVLKYFVLYT